MRAPGRRTCGYRCGTLLCVVLCTRGSRARVCCVVGYVSAGGCRKKEGGWNSVPTPLFEECCGGVLLSHTLPGAVPSALAGLASRFGMGAGRFPAAMTTTRWFNQYSHIPPLVGGLCWL